MSIFIGKYEFDGPYHHVDDLKDKQGIFAVLHRDGEDYELVHVAHAENIRERIEHVHSPNNPRGTVLLAALYTPTCGNIERNTMVEDIQSEFDD